MAMVFTATVSWTGEAEAFRSGRYSRRHEWRFDGGAVVPGSSGPAVVPVPMSDPAAVDPEEALVAAASSCHMLYFLHYAKKHGLTVTAYEDEAEGVMTPNADGKLFVSAITLRPRIAFDGETPSAELVEQVHHEAHLDCFIANSIKAEVTVQSR